MFDMAKVRLPRKQCYLTILRTNVVNISYNLRIDGYRKVQFLECCAFT